MWIRKYYYTKICSETDNTEFEVLISFPLIDAMPCHPADGVCMYRGVAMKTEAGVVRSTLAGANIA